MIAALKTRLDPDGTKEITIREYGPAVEIIIPQTGQDEMEFVKRRITDMGQLEFRITADPTLPKDRPIIEQAKRLPPSVRRTCVQGDNKVAEWVAYDVEEFGPVDDASGSSSAWPATRPKRFVLIDPTNVTGEYLTSATKGLDERGGPAVHFAFDRRRRAAVRTAHQSEQAESQHARRVSPPGHHPRQATAQRAAHHHDDFRPRHDQRRLDDRAEVEHIIEILNAGSLPAALNKTPISEEDHQPDARRRDDRKGKMAIGGSLIAVVLFMIVYYRFAGIVACLALTFNLLLVLALMVLIKAAFTLPGLAGLVLTIGMSVDANVLIYERIREELKSGAALRMAIRNGFSRAMSAIIDSNVTTIITGIVLFYIGTDQVKGFAVTLILGILTSMFTAIFFARLVFDVAERRGWIKQRADDEAHGRSRTYDFLGVRWVAIGASLRR